MKRIMLILIGAAILFSLGSAANAQDNQFGAADPVARDIKNFDSMRPIEKEMEANVPDGFAVTAVGDLIISRPLSQYAARMPAFDAVLDVLKGSSVAIGNLETTIFDPRYFQGAPYSNEGDWTVSSLPAVAQDLSAMGFSMVSRANNHSQDWGLEGMRETSRWLDDAGLIYAGVGESHPLSRAPQYFESTSGRVALISIASTFRPTSESLPATASTPGRPGLSGLHVSQEVRVPEAALKPLAEASCALENKNCDDVPTKGKLFGTSYQQGEVLSYEHEMDPDDLAEIYRNIRAAQLNADFVVVTIHSHECSLGCSSDNSPRGPANFLKALARGAIDSGADIFVTTGNHNIGPIEVYNSPARGNRPIFYGLGNFFWSDIQEFLPSDLFRANRDTLAKFWENPEKATEYDLSAPLNTEYFAHAFTFQSVIADVRFEHNQLSKIILHPLELGYGRPLTESGIPQLVMDKDVAREIFLQVTEQTEKFGLPDLKISYTKTTAVIRP